MLTRLRTFFAALTKRSRMEREMDVELRFHLDAYKEDLVARGVARGEAARRARLEFGAVGQVSEQCREARGLRWPDELVRNCRYALRLFRRTPGFTAAAVATLGLCIGANTAIFSIVDAVLLRPLPYPQPERLGMLGMSMKVKGLTKDDNSFTGEGWFLIRDHARSLDLASYTPISSGANFNFGRRSEYVRQQRVGAGFFRVLGVPPLAGREFTPQEDRPGGPAIAVLSYGFWKRALHGDTGVLGRGILLRGEPYVVVGVMPPHFRSDIPADVWTPLRPSTEGEGDGTNYGIVARVRPGFTWQQAQAEAALIGQSVVRNLRERNYLSRDAEARSELLPLQRGLTAELLTPLLMLWAAVAAVLLIGCVNVAGLLLARGASRAREIATRMALGGGRAAVVRQLLTESLLLSLAGGLLGVLLGYGGLIALRRYSEMLGIWQDVELNARVLAATAAIALATSILFGLAPALAAVRSDVRAALTEGGARGIAGSRRLWTRQLLVPIEVALGFVLLTSAGLLLRTFANMNGQPAGFDSSGILTARMSLEDARYRDPAKANLLADRALARMRALPGVESAALALHLPYERPVNLGVRRLDGPQVDPEHQYQMTNFSYVTPEYFRVMRIRLLRGRTFGAADSARAQPVTLVNEAFARRYFPDTDALGRHLGMFNRSWTVAGVVASVPHHADFGNFEKPEAAPMVYISLAQTPGPLFETVHTWFSPSWVVRAAVPAGELVPGVTRAVEAVDPLLPLTGFEPMDELRAGSMRGHRFLAVLLGTLAALALLLAFVGIYGLVANSVAMRTRELGIRMALGAAAPRVIRAVVAPGVVLALAGVAAGFGLALPATRLLESLLFGIAADDPATYAGVALCLLLAALAASVVPALRIARLNPAETLRHE
ncbi:MAG TPA: ABC transporter permease [Bryobacteraceae bacterium]|nr:ABC transporter permease [Bryobacteraceae bacterium]